MNLLNEEQRKRALEVLDLYLAAPSGPDGKTPVEASADLDKKRVQLIESDLKPLMTIYLGGRMGLDTFKSRIDSTNKRNSLWGFRGIKGQMFFNLLLNAADDTEECDAELKAAIAIPSDDNTASSRLKTFLSYVKRIGDRWVERGNKRHGAPTPGSIPFFLSYFWQIQEREIWPVYYTNAVQTMTDLNIWRPSEDLAQDYLAFKWIHGALVRLFSETINRPFGLYDVEHVFWYIGADLHSASRPIQGEPSSPPLRQLPTDGEGTKVDRLPESYIPPIISVLPAMARHEAKLVEASKSSGTSLDRAFEKSVDAAFTMLGYETKLLGQGQGRVPDGRALAVDESYAILWDAKVREKPYSLGTDDRAIREYISTQSRELSRRYRNIYYLIVSSAFADDFDDAISSIKMETDVSEVILLHADALVAMVEAKLRAPLEVTLGSDGLQRLFTTSGGLTAEMVREYLV